MKRRSIIAHDISIIFQNPQASLNPIQTIGKQIKESLTYANIKKPSNQEALELLKRSELNVGENFLKKYPSELSGGQQQRVIIAMALAKRPKLLIADEPTTALDVTIQKEILGLLLSLQKEDNISILFITHDLSLVKAVARKVLIIKNGDVIETNKIENIKSSKKPYTKKLFQSQLNPRERLRLEKVVADGKKNDKSKENQTTAKNEISLSVKNEISLSVKNLDVFFSIKSDWLRRETNRFHAVKNISFSLREGKTLGVIGESGSGKTSLGLAILRLTPSSGLIFLGKNNLSELSANQIRNLRLQMQIVFQDPYSSLSPRQTIGMSIIEGLYSQKNMDKKEIQYKMDEMMDLVGLEKSMEERYPHELSGGEKQRVAIARAMIMRPKLLILDEPTSSLDVTLQKQILYLLLDLQKKFLTSYLFISHDLSVIGAMSDEVIVMKEGEVVERGETKKLLSNPRTKYVKKLISSKFI